ncbi:membrane-spanning 4-domains subfamily A member 13-like [Nannospalax galili]|uniref:membrane-spanning 4-domains subfamily A member 13-like n=1 Tax=Nannospalax galili TaxID=1026970 RepID=UPI00111C02E1|nr:membrane-spanning 4-domains subfamily A member 13-like [Nannospalax galili]
MPEDNLHLRKELRALGVIQLMTSLIIQSLGYFWSYLFFSQSIVFGVKAGYVTVIRKSRYALWGSFCFYLSGCFSIMVQKKPSDNLVLWTLSVNIISMIQAMTGVALILLEFILTARLESSLWQHRTGRMLSEYMFLFSILEIFASALATEWIYQAQYEN